MFKSGTAGSQPYTYIPRAQAGAEAQLVVFIVRCRPRSQAGAEAQLVMFKVIYRLECRDNDSGNEAVLDSLLLGCGGCLEL